MLNCNVNICAHNKNGQCQRENVIINLNVYDGLIPYCSDFDTSIEYVRQQYGIHRYNENTVVVVVKDSMALIAEDMAKIKKIIEEDFQSSNIEYIYFDNAVKTGRHAKNRVFECPTKKMDYKLAPQNKAKQIIEFVNEKYPHIGNF